MLQVGHRVRFKSTSDINPIFHGKLGTVEAVRDRGYTTILMDEPIYGTRGPYSCPDGIVERIDMTPEEEAQVLERQRQAEEQRRKLEEQLLDQKRRLAHAMKYL